MCNDKSSEQSIMEQVREQYAQIAEGQVNQNVSAHSMARIIANLIRSAKMPVETSPAKETEPNAENWIELSVTLSGGVYAVRVPLDELNTSYEHVPHMSLGLGNRLARLLRDRQMLNRKPHGNQAETD